MEMDLALKIVALTALIAFILLSIFAIVSLMGAMKSLREVTQSIETVSKQLDVSFKHISTDFSEMKIRLSQSLDNFDITTKQVTYTAKSLQDGTEGIINTISSYTGLFNRLYDSISLPINDVILYSSAIRKAVSTFTGFFLGKHK